jgi:outer membrane murein-binding lipoprotein Lpp
MRIVWIVLSIIVLAGCAQPAKTTRAEGKGPEFPELDATFGKLERDTQELNKAAAALKWFDQHLQPLALRYDEAFDRLSKTTAPTEKEKIRAEIKALAVEISAKEKEFDRVARQNGWTLPKPKKSDKP